MSGLVGTRICPPILFLTQLQHRKKTTKYFVTVTDIVTGCKTTDSAIVTVQAPIANAGPDHSLCGSSTITLGTPAVGIYTYAWKPTTLSEYRNGTDPSSAQPDVFVSVTQEYSLTVTDTITGCLAYDTVDIVVNGTPTLNAGDDVTICLGESVQIGDDPILNVTYSWNNTSTLSSGTVANPVATPTTTTTYEVTATFPGGSGCNVIESVIVTVSDPAFTMADISYCPDDGPVAIGVNAPSAMSSYSWSPAAGVTDASIRNPNTDPTPGNGFTYTLTIENSDGCVASAPVNIVPCVTPPDVIKPKKICLGDALTIGDDNNPTSGYSYLWTGTATGDLSSTTSINPTFTPSSAGSFEFRLTKTKTTAPNNGETAWKTVVITVEEFDIPALSSTTVCEDATAQIGTTPASGATYQWTPITNIESPNSSITNVSPDATTTYTLIGTGINGCIDREEVIVGVNPTPAPTITLNDATACLGENDQHFNPSVSPSGSYSYIWSPNNGNIDSINVLNPSINATSVGTVDYTLEVINSSGCKSTKTATLTTEQCPQTAYSIGNLVFWDLDRDGIKDVSEPGIQGVKVILIDAAGAKVAETTTDVDGKYYFYSVQPGEYQVAVTSSTSNGPLIGAGVTPVRFQTEDIDDRNDGSATDGIGRTSLSFTSISPVVTLMSADEPTNESEEDPDPNQPDSLSNLTVDFGFTPLLIGDYVWQDLNGNGIQDVSDTGINGITVELYDASGVLVTSTTTSNGGQYIFSAFTTPAIVPGNYEVRIASSQLGISDFGVTVPNNGNGANDSRGTVNGSYVTSGLFNAPFGENLDIDFGFVDLMLGNYIWLDKDLDGLQDANELGIEGVTVTLHNTLGTQLASRQTDANGYWFFDRTDGLTPSSDFEVRISSSQSSTEDLGVTKLKQGNDGEVDSDGIDSNAYITSGIVTTPATGGKLDIDFGFVGYSLGSQVWEDVNNNGQIDIGEEGIAGVILGLIDTSGTLVAIAVTDSSGDYNFPGLEAGTYQVAVISDLVSGALENYNVSGVTNTSIDEDNNNDGSSIDPQGNTSISFSSISDNVGLEARSEPTNETDEDPNTDQPDNQSNRTIDFGFAPLAIGNRVWIDANGNGIQDSTEPGVSNTKLYLYSSGGATLLDSTITDGVGEYAFTSSEHGIQPSTTYQIRIDKGQASINGLSITTTGAGNSETDNNGIDSTTYITSGDISSPATGPDFSFDFGFESVLIGDRVWLDINANGIQDSVEVGIEGVVVELYDNGGVQLGSVTTNLNGNFFFSTVDGVLPSTNYEFRIPSNQSAITDLGITGTGTGTASTDNNGVDSGAYYSSGTVTSPATGSNLDFDFGFIGYSLGNKVWWDNDNDGILDSNEIGISGVNVILLDSLGNQVGSTSTDASGNYLFPGLLPGDYQVAVTSSLNAGVLDGAQISGTTNTSADVDNNNDGSSVDPVNAANTPSFTSISDIITLEGKSEPSNESDEDPNPFQPDTLSNLTVDFGFAPPTTSVGNLVFWDKNNDGDFDSGSDSAIGGIKIYLYQDANGDGTANELIDSVVSDVNGLYSFIGIGAGRFRLVVAPDNFTSSGSLSTATATTNGNSGDTISDNNSEGNQSGVFILTPNNQITSDAGDDALPGFDDNDANFTFDFGFYGNGGGPLPVELISFDVTKIGERKASLLTWKTASEINNSHFEIERSQDLVNWTYLGEVVGKGNTGLTTNYHFVDETPETGVNYYRLKQVDFDGNFEYTEVRVLVFNSTKEIQVYPNPATSIINIDLPVEDATATIELIDYSGAVVVRKELNGQKHAEIETSRFSRGVYCIRVRLGNAVFVEQVAIFNE
jgi:hypothetical protein